MVNHGQVKIDASITSSPFSPKGKTTYELAEDRKEEERNVEEIEKERKISCDKEEKTTPGRWRSPLVKEEQ